jgi:ubiquinone/menaquinone biosynthesis C-methylase UbiE
MISTTVCIIFGLLLCILILDLIIRVIRHHFKFPIPASLVDLIDNPVRRIIQPPNEMPIRHGIESGMTVLEVGPGNGVYTVETARQVSPTGKVIAVDIQPKIIERLKIRANAEHLTNIEGMIVNVHHLPFTDGVFDAIYMIAVIGEIPGPEKALQEFYRVLAPPGTLAFSELLPDPDYPLARTLTKWAAQANFRLSVKLGNFFVYTSVFEKGKTKNRSLRDSKLG